MSEQNIETAVQKEMADSGHNFNRVEVVKIINAVAEKMVSQPGFTPNAMKVELEGLLGKIQDTRNEVASIAAPDSLSNNGINDARDELDAVVEATEKASGEIMDACERIQTQAEKTQDDVKNALFDETTKIFEACSFQDITGQRISKVVAAIKDIEENIIGVLGYNPADQKQEEAPKDISDVTDEDLLNGPQMADKAISQDDIDKLLADFE